MSYDSISAVEGVLIIILIVYMILCTVIYTVNLIDDRFQTINILTNTKKTFQYNDTFKTYSCVRIQTILK